MSWSASGVDRAKVAAEPCSCVMCWCCGGSGSYYVHIGGRFIGQHRIDDLSDLEMCDECGGVGIAETCDRCRLLEDMDYEQQELA